MKCNNFQSFFKQKFILFYSLFSWDLYTYNKFMKHKRKATVLRVTHNLKNAPSRPIQIEKEVVVLTCSAWSLWFARAHSRTKREGRRGKINDSSTATVLFGPRVKAQRIECWLLREKQNLLWNSSFATGRLLLKHLTSMDSFMSMISWSSDL